MFDTIPDPYADWRLLIALWPVPAAILEPGGRVVAANDLFWCGGRSHDAPFGTLHEHLSRENQQALARQQAVVWGYEGVFWHLVPCRTHPWLFCVQDDAPVRAAPVAPPTQEPPPLDWQGQKLQALGQLAGGVAHDFNNILTAILGHCDLMLERAGPGDPLFADLIQIRHNSQRAAGLVQQLLAFSRQQTLQLAPVDLSPLVLELQHLLRRLVGERIRLVCEAPDVPMWVHADPGQVEQMLVNLVVNARDALPGAGDIIMSLSRASIHAPRPLMSGEVVPSGDYIRIMVADNGPGIPPEVQHRLFEPFFTTKPAGQGTGLGLAMVHGAIRQMQGFVTCDSAPGRGSAFCLWFPAIAVPSVVTAGRAEPVHHTPSPLAMAARDEEMILLIEDEEPVRRVAARTLRHKGYIVLEARDGEEAANLFHNPAQRIDLVISDVILPDCSAPELVRTLRAVRPDVPVLLMSGYAAEMVRAQMGDIDQMFFIAKPFSLQDFIRMVRLALDYMSGAQPMPDIVLA